MLSSERDIPPYAILSHTWDDEEVSHQEIDCPTRDQKKGFAKVLGCCRLARKDGLEWAWIDTWMDVSNASMRSRLVRS